MTKKHFNAFAAVVRHLRQEAQEYADKGEPQAASRCRHQAEGVEYAVVEVSEQFNGRFDAERFRKACEPKD